MLSVRVIVYKMIVYFLKNHTYIYLDQDIFKPFKFPHKK